MRKCRLIVDIVGVGNERAFKIKVDGRISQQDMFMMLLAVGNFIYNTLTEKGDIKTRTIPT